jgi:hypothetical protein
MVKRNGGGRSQQMLEMNRKKGLLKKAMELSLLTGA